MSHFLLMKNKQAIDLIITILLNMIIYLYSFKCSSIFFVFVFFFLIH
jgi:hypothetical protein